MVTGRTPESKRDSPLRVSFCKIFEALGKRYFPPFPITGRLSHEISLSRRMPPIDILSGAFMFMRRETLDKSGLPRRKFFHVRRRHRSLLSARPCRMRNYLFPADSYYTLQGESTKKEACDTSVSFMKLCFFQKAYPRARQRVLPRRKILYILPSLVSRCLPSRLFPFHKRGKTDKKRGKWYILSTPQTIARLIPGMAFAYMVGR